MSNVSNNFFWFYDPINSNNSKTVRPIKFQQEYLFCIKKSGIQQFAVKIWIKVHAKKVVGYFFSTPTLFDPPLNEIFESLSHHHIGHKTITRHPSVCSLQVPSDMGNKPSVSEGEEDEDRPALSLKGAKSLGSEIANGGGEDADEEVELPPPMKPIQEPILVTSPPPGYPTSRRILVSSLTLKSLEGATSADLAEIEQIVKERMEQHSENQERNSLMRDAKSETAISDYGDNTNAHHRDLSAQCSSNEATALAFSGDESDKPTDDSVDSAKTTEALLRKRQYVLKELIDTEEAYVRDLSLIVDGYIAAMADPNCEIPMPEDLRNGRDKLVFGNIEVIYNWHKK
ncbi:hypothetical protein NQ317_012957 [Molorchus minor]|uniref:DH domain-containing protein n=1 Tax=Molorchus minor TaxID=1323400 RepID=A0ABQ9IY32_9CUCU|nr:hypothetical protein NQ317_012957 [Molorchus minor]